MEKKLAIISFALLSAPGVFAAPQKQHLTLGYEYKNYSKHHGNRNVGYLEYGYTFDRGAIVSKLSGGSRDYGSGSGSNDGVEGKADLYYNWNKYLSTKTGLTFSDNTPTFVRREYRQEFNIKAIDNVVLTTGGKHTEYYGDVDVNAWLLGGAWYYKRFIVMYRYTHYHSNKAGNSHGNTISVRLKDKTGEGHTQMWLGFGDSAHAYDWDPSNRKSSGDFKGVTLRRVQPISANWSVGMALGKSWYETPIYDYNSTNAQLDLIYKW